jgi:hypothetical protein
VWTYRQKTGELLRDGTPLCVLGYSGRDEGKNCPAMQDRHDLGPIPQGRWKIAELILETATHGPYVLRLIPAAETVTFGRSGFLIHGDSRSHPGTASRGCIILPRSARELVWMSGDHDLTVESGELPAVDRLVAGSPPSPWNTQPRSTPENA